jgi:hypothetical protein
VLLPVIKDEVEAKQAKAASTARKPRGAVKR